MAPVYGIYAGFEFCEGTPVRPGSEEYLDSEKYEIKVRDQNAAGNIKRDVSRINRIRRAEPALSRLTNLEFCHTESEDIIAYIKRDAATDKPRHLLAVVNVNPHKVVETMVHVPLATFGILPGKEYRVRDLLTGTTYTWRGAQNYVRLDPSDKVGHLFRVEPL